ncbi:MAG: EAL domain-containing protein [Bacilli bacterium]|nr:EAL domain-containing protein [Bacilli bacterium]
MNSDKQKNIITTQRRNVLIVEDEEINREILKEILSEEFTCLEAENGKEAIDVLRFSSVPISLILLDINMPVMNGFEFMKRVKSSQQYRHIPIIVLTSDKENELESLHMGAVDFIKKPYEFPEIIIARSKRSIELSEDRSLIQKTQRDDLTGVYISEVFHEYVERIDQYNPDRENDLTVVDIEKFDLLHALYGDILANRILALLAKTMTELVRQYDGIIGRYQDHAFLVYANRIEDYQEVYDTVVGSLAEEGNLGDLAIKFGVYRVSDKSEPVSTRINHANHARETLRGTSTPIAIYDAEFERQARFEQDLINGLNQALEERQFVVNFQPKTYIQGDKEVIGGGEALVRWIHPLYGFIPPGTFIPLFEANGQIKLIDRYVWEEAGRMIRKIKDEYGVDIPISVNVSRAEMLDEDILDIFLSIARENNIDRSLIHIEITESAYSHDVDKIVEVSENFKKHGFLIEIDDFGSGYSSLNSLTSLPFDIIKLDMKFTREMELNDKTMKMVEIVADIARFFSAKLVAEGAETASQVEKLKQIGYDYVQGYYFSKPLKGDDFLAYVAAHR